MSRWILIAALGLLPIVAIADDANPFAVLTKERLAKRQEMVKGYREAKEDDRDAIYKTWQKVDGELATKLIELAVTHAKLPEAFEPLVMAFAKGGEKKSTYAELIRIHHADQAHISRDPKLLRMLAQSKDGEPLLEFMIAKNSLSGAKASAALAIGEQAKLELARKLSDDAKAKYADKARKHLTIALESAVGDDPDLKSIRGLARGALAGVNNLDNLKVGAQAPDIDGIDTDGKPIKLSDYRGQVVLLDFWAFWCHSCMAMVPHERTIVESLKGKPFVILGVNGDLEYDDAFRDNIRKHKVPWKSFRNAPGGDRSTISEAWNVGGWPTLYLIDAKGVIRKIWLGGPDKEKELDEEIEKLLAEIKK